MKTLKSVIQKLGSLKDEIIDQAQAIQKDFKVVLKDLVKVT